MHSMYSSTVCIIAVLIAVLLILQAIKTIGTTLGLILKFSLYSAKQVQKLAEELEEVC